MTVTKKELAQKVKQALDTELTQISVSAIVQKTIDTMAEALSEGKSITLRNFGTFKVVEVKAKVGRNPKDPKKDVAIPARKVVKFKAGRELKGGVADAGQAE